MVVHAAEITGHQGSIARGSRVARLDGLQSVGNPTHFPGNLAKELISV